MRFFGSVINDITVRVHRGSDVRMPDQLLLHGYWRSGWPL
jgi:hypothetical protein